MRTLSKSKLLAFRQCPKRLWLEIHAPQLREDSGATLANYATGHQVGDIARQIYDPAQHGQLIDPQVEGFDEAFARTQTLLRARQPIFEAGFRAEARWPLPTCCCLRASNGAWWRSSPAPA